MNKWKTHGSNTFKETSTACTADKRLRLIFICLEIKNTYVFALKFLGQLFYLASLPIIVSKGVVGVQGRSESFVDCWTWTLYLRKTRTFRFCWTDTGARGLNQNKGCEICFRSRTRIRSNRTGTFGSFLEWKLLTQDRRTTPPKSKKNYGSRRSPWRRRRQQDVSMLRKSHQFSPRAATWNKN